MNSTLELIISHFRKAQDRAVSTIRDDLNWKLPSSNRDWVFLCGSQGYNDIRELNGIVVYTHGYGVELRYQDLVIDFDWGEKGEGTGFDVWRLWSYCELNNQFLDRCSHDSIKQWVIEADESKELVKDRLLWYRPLERDIKTTMQNKAAHTNPLHAK